MKQRGRRGPEVSPVPLPSTAAWWTVVLVLVVAPVCGGGHQILWGRCYSYCVQRHLLQAASSEEADPDALPKNPIRACQRHQNCRWCLYVCERPKDNFTNSTACLRDCRYTRTRPRSGGRQACTEACGFVGRASSARGGTCPAPVSLNGFQSACVTSCHRDGDCSRAEEKCCSNNCGAVCTAPYDVHILPPVPSNISFKMLKTGGVMVKWRLGDTPEDSGSSTTSRTISSSSSSGKMGSLWAGSPVVYILRWWCPYTSGALNSVTDRARTKLQGYPTGIYPGSKCHFMVAAVNQHGSRGFSQVSPYIKKFLTPSPPLHLDQVRTRLTNDGQVDITVQWQPPVYTDGLPVFKYQVFWSDHLPQASPNYMRFHMYRRVLDADKTTFVLQSLRLGTLYFVQVRAVVRWKGRQKRGELASAYIETYSPPHPPSSSPHGEEGDGEGAGKADDSEDSIIQSVQVNQTFYHDTVLKTAITWTLKPDKSARKYLIYWRAETCARSDHRKVHRRLETSATSHDRRFTLYNLQPECEYAVRVHPVNKRGHTGAAIVTNFLTPACHLVEVRQGEPPVCQTSDPPGQVQGLHAETSRCVTVIRWEPASSESDDVESYDVMWGETEAGVFSSTIIYTNVPREISVPANKSHVELGQLTSGQHYSIQVKATSAGGSGPPAVLHLLVPFPDASCGSEDTVEDTSHHSNPTMTSLAGTDDVNDTADVSGSVSETPPVSTTKTRPTGSNWTSTDEGSVELSLDDDVQGRGDSVSVESGEGDRDTTPGPPTPSATTKDLTDATSENEHSRYKTETDWNVRGESVPKGTAFSTPSNDSHSPVTIPTNMIRPTPWGTVVGKSHTSSSTSTTTTTILDHPSVKGAGVALKASLWTWMVCCSWLLLCVSVFRTG